MKRCRYNVPTESFTIDAATGEETTQPFGAARLCSWTNDAQEAVAMVGMPIWIQRVAVSGAYMKDDDCEKCAAYKPDVSHDIHRLDE